MQRKQEKKPVKNTGSAKSSDASTTPGATDALSSQARKRLAKLETVIRRADLSYIEKGNALNEINVSRLYRQNFESFAAYCDKVWDMEKATAHRFINAAAVANVLKDAGYEVPANENQARQLTRFLADPNQLKKVWRAVLKRGEPITAKLIETIAEKLFPKPNEDDDGSGGKKEADGGGGGNDAGRGEDPHPHKEYGFTVIAKASPEALTALGQRLHLSPNINKAKGIGDIAGRSGDSYSLFCDLAAWIEDNKPMNFSLELKETKPEPGQDKMAEGPPPIVKEE